MHFIGNEKAKTRVKNRVDIPKKYLNQFDQCDHISVTLMPEWQTIVIEPLSSKQVAPKWAAREKLPYQVIPYNQGVINLSNEFSNALNVDVSSRTAIRKLTFVGMGNHLELTSDWPISSEPIKWENMSEELRNLRL